MLDCPSDNFLIHPIFLLISLSYTSIGFIIVKSRFMLFA